MDCEVLDVRVSIEVIVLDLIVGVGLHASLKSVVHVSQSFVGWFLSDLASADINEEIWIDSWSSAGAFRDWWNLSCVLPIKGNNSILSNW